MKFDAVNCPCKRLKCERHGDCNACIEYHHTSKRKLFTYCEKVENKMERKKQKNMDGIELPGFKKKSFSMYFGGGEIWFEHLDGIYGFTDLVIEKLKLDYEQFKNPSMPSLIAVNLDETLVNEELCNEIVRVFTAKGKRYTKIVFVGVKRSQKKCLQKLLSNNGFALAFINDFEKAKEWLIS